MAIKQCRFILAALALGAASAASSYKITLPADVSVGDAMLKAGVYSMSLEGKEAIFKRGKESIKVPFAIEKSLKKFDDTGLELAGPVLKAIDLGGTDKQVVFRSTH